MKYNQKPYQYQAGILVPMYTMGFTDNTSEKLQTGLQVKMIPLFKLVIKFLVNIALSIITIIYLLVIISRS